MNVIVDIWATTAGIFDAAPFVREMQGVQISGIEKSAKHSSYFMGAKYDYEIPGKLPQDFCRVTLPELMGFWENALDTQ